MADPEGKRGVDPQPGDVQEQGVPSPGGTTQEKGVPTEPETPPATGVPAGEPMAQQPPRVEGQVPSGYVSQADMDKLRSQYDRQAWELRQELQETQRKSKELQYQAETAGMPDDEKWKYLFEKQQEEMRQIRQQQEEQYHLEGYRQYIAQLFGLNPAELNPYHGVQGMMYQASQLINKPPSQQARPPQARPPQTPPTVPAPPMSPAPKSGYDELMDLPWEERRKRVPRRGTKASERFMENLGEEE